MGLWNVVSAHLSPRGRKQTSFLSFISQFLSLLSGSLEDHGLVGLARQQLEGPEMSMWRVPEAQSRTSHVLSRLSGRGSARHSLWR